MTRPLRTMRALNARQRRSKKRTVLARDGAVCASCSTPHQPADLILKRIIHRNLGGSSRLDNLHLLCHACNRAGTRKATP